MRDLGGHCEPRILVWRGNPKFFTLSNLLFSFLRLRKARSLPQSLLAMTGKESPRDDGKESPHDGRNLAIGGKRCWQKVGGLGEGDSQGERKMGEGNFPPPFF